MLVGLIEPSGPAAGLIRADSSIWESHWYDGGRQHWAFTQATSVLGLRAAARLADRIGRGADAARYRAAAAALAAAATAALITPGRLIRASLEQTTANLDAAAVGFLRWGLVPPDGDVAIGTLEAWRQGLAVPSGHGIHRNDDGGEYDRREWIAVDMWLADAWRAAGRADRADALVAWVTAQARLNYDLIPENYHRDTGDYLGEVPMAGFGAGAYVSALWRRAATPPGPGQQYAFEVDLDLCSGCKACVTACRSWNDQGQGGPLAELDPYGAKPEGAWLNRVQPLAQALKTGFAQQSPEPDAATAARRGGMGGQGRGTFQRQRAKILIQHRKRVVDIRMPGVLGKPVGEAIPVRERGIALANDPVDGLRLCGSVRDITHRTASGPWRLPHKPCADRPPPCSG